MAGPRFSIVVTCHNQCKFIRAAVDSALIPHDPCQEIIVVDDGSSDGCSRILQQYADSIHLIELPNNMGAIEARNRGAAVASGEYLVFLDGDDLFLPWTLRAYARVITERNPTVIFAKMLSFQGVVPRVVQTELPHRIEFVDYQSTIAKDRSCRLSASAFVVSRKAFEDVGGWSPGIFHMDLYDMGIKLGCSGNMIMICSPYTVLYRVHDANSIHSVPPFLQKAHQLIAKERTGAYPGGVARRFQRYGWLGGIFAFWTKRALGVGLYKDAIRLALAGAPMILAAAVRRAIALIRGRRPGEILDFSNS